MLENLGNMTLDFHHTNVCLHSDEFLSDATFRVVCPRGALSFNRIRSSSCQEKEAADADCEAAKAKELAEKAEVRCGSAMSPTCTTLVTCIA